MKLETLVDQIEITRKDHIQVRLGLLILDDAGVEVSRNWHRFVLCPGDDCTAVLDVVNKHLESMGRPPVSNDYRLSRLHTIIEAVHTPSIVSAFKAEQAAALKATA